MATVTPSRTRTMVSVSLTRLDASGSWNCPRLPRLMTRERSLTSLTEGLTCSVTMPWSSICGVTSSEMPEKKGCSVSDGVVTLPLAVAVVVVSTLVTKKSSVPTRRTAFWLLTAATRGDDRT